jgi:hypothetical protein
MDPLSNERTGGVVDVSDDSSGVRGLWGSGTTDVPSQKLGASCTGRSVEQAAERARSKDWLVNCQCPTTRMAGL